MQDAGAKLQAALDEDRQAVVAGKRFLLFEEMCRDAGITDEGLQCLQLNRAPTGLFRSDETEAAVTEVQLMKSARWSRRKILGEKRGDPQSAEVRAAVWEITMGASLGIGIGPNCGAPLHCLQKVRPGTAGQSKTN